MRRAFSKNEGDSSSADHLNQDRSMKTALSLILVLYLLAACQSASYQQTLEVNHAQAGTQIADLRISATVQAARARTTVDFVQTRAIVAATRSGALEATMMSVGTPAEALAAFRSRMIQAAPTATIPLAFTEESEFVTLVSNVPLQTQPPSPTIDLTVSPTIPIVTPFALLATQAPPSPTRAPTIDPNQPRLENPQLATSSGADDCGAEFSTQFTTSTPEIYIIVTVVNAPANTTFEARWQREGQAIGGLYTYTPDFAIDRACIWFFVDSSDFEFIAGNYTVTVDINSVPAITPLVFTIIDG